MLDFHQPFGEDDFMLMKKNTDGQFLILKPIQAHTALNYMAVQISTLETKITPSTASSKGMLLSQQRYNLKLLKA